MIVLVSGGFAFQIWFSESCSSAKTEVAPSTRRLMPTTVVHNGTGIDLHGPTTASPVGAGSAGRERGDLPDDVRGERACLDRCLVRGGAHTLDTAAS